MSGPAELVQAPALDIFEGIEDDIEVDDAPVDGGTTHGAPIRFARLSKKPVPRALTTDVDTPASNTEREGSVLYRASMREDGEDGEDGVDGEDGDEGHAVEFAEQAPGASYWDEEDEIEAYVAEKQAKGKNVYDGEYEDALSDDGSSSSGDDEELDIEDAGLLAGDGAIRGEMDAETQRLLREVAAKDRLGKGQKVQIKALSGIVDKLKRKKEEVVGRAAALRAPEVPSFDDIVGAAMPDLSNAGAAGVVGVVGAAGVVSEPGREEAVGGEADAAACADRKDDGQDGEQKGMATPVQMQKKSGGIASFFKRAAEMPALRAGHVPHGEEGEEGNQGDGDDVLDIVDDENDGNCIVELPRMRTPSKPSPLAFNLEYNKSAEMDDFVEEKPLIDDGIGTDEDSDSESDHSWAVHEKADDDGVKDDVVSGGPGHGGKGGDGTDDGTDDGVDDEIDVETGNTKDQPQNEDNLVTFVRMKDNMKKLSEAERATAAVLQAKQSNRFLDEEAELSDDEGMGIAVSDDEDEGNAQDVDQNGELKDLIDASGKNLDKNNEATEELHIKWARQQEAQQLKNILRGLENGFGRRNRGPLDDEDGDMSGRRRRARRDDDDGDFNLDTAWPSLFGSGGTFGIGHNNKDDDGEECEDEIVLRKAAQRKLVESQSERLFGADGSFSIPLDEDSQHVLELFNNSGGNANGVGGTEDGRLLRNPGLKRLHSKDRTMSTQSSEPLSFLGRQSKVQRQTSKSNMGVSMNKTFVFGRVNANDSQPGGEDERENVKPLGTQNSQSVCGAIDFSGLKNELKSQEHPQQNLLKSLPRWNKKSDRKKQASGAVFDVVNSMMNGKIK